MECRIFEITLTSAKDLEDVCLLGKMKVHARVSVGGGGPEWENRTPTDKHGKINPDWNFTTRFTVGESAVENYNTMLVVKLYCTRKLGDRYIGEVNTSMKELFDVSRATGGSAVMCYKVKKGSVNSKGELNFSYNFGEKVMIDKLLLAQTISPGGAVADVLRTAGGTPPPPPPPKKLLCAIYVSLVKHKVGYKK